MPSEQRGPVGGLVGACDKPSLLCDRTPYLMIKRQGRKGTAILDST